MMKKSKYRNENKFEMWTKGRLYFLGLCCFFLAACAGNDKAVVFTVQEDFDTRMLLQTEETVNTEESNGENLVQENNVTVYVHVCGAVNSPKVVELPEGSRVQEALTAAGGFREDAALDFVNLASKVEDGQRIYFPTKEEAEKYQGSMEMEQNGQNALVNINTADRKLLCTLPGIGEARAEAILDYREQKGGFASTEDIMRVPGIKQSAYDKLRDRITVN